MKANRNTYLAYGVFALAAIGVLMVIIQLLWPVPDLEQSFTLTTLVFAALLVFIGYRLWVTRNDPPPPGR
jgi:heme A synthase